MKFLVFGAGSIGSFLGGLLSREHDVTLVARTAQVDAVNRRGLRISGITTFLARPTAATAAPPGEYDVVFVTTKAYDTANAIEALSAWWRRSTFVTLQNGLGNAEVIAAKADRVAAGTTSHGVTFVAPGEIVHAGAGDSTLGPVQGLSVEALRPIAEALTRAGMTTSVVADVRRTMWSKAVVNAAINPPTAVLRVPNGILVDREDLRALLEHTAREGALAARAAGVELEPDDLARETVKVARRTGGNRSSMLQDVERGQRTEIEAITGALLSAGEAHGLAMPYNRMLSAIARGLEQGFRAA